MSNLEVIYFAVARDTGSSVAFIIITPAEFRAGRGPQILMLQGEPPANSGTDVTILWT